MARSSSRPPAGTRGSSRPEPRVPGAAGRAGERPLPATLAAVFGLLVAAVDGYLTWLLWTPEGGWDPYLLVPVLLGVLALMAAAAVFLGVPRAWLALAVAAALPLVGMLAVVALFAVLGGGSALWGALVLLIAPAGALLLALRRPVREWTGSARAERAPAGRRGPGSSG